MHSLYSIFLLQCCTELTCESWADWWIGLFLFVCRWLSRGKTNREWASWVQHKSTITFPLHTENRTDKTMVLLTTDSFSVLDLELLEKCLGTVLLKPLTQQISDVSRVSCLGQIPNGKGACGLLTIKYYSCFKCHSILLVLRLAVTVEQSKSRWTSGCTSLTGVTAALEVP